MSKPINARVKDIADLLETVVRDLDNIVKELQATQPKRNITVKSIKGIFTAEQLEFLHIEETESDILVIFNDYMPSMVFSDACNRVEGAGGEYVKKTEDTEPYFKIPK